MIDNMVELSDSIQADCDHAVKMNRENQELAAKIEAGVYEYSRLVSGYDKLKNDLWKKAFTFKKQGRE